MLVEPDTVTAASIVRIFEPRASNLEHVSGLVQPAHVILPSASDNNHKQWQFAGAGLPGDKPAPEEQEAANKRQGDSQVPRVEVGMGLGEEVGAYDSCLGAYGTAHAVAADNVAQAQGEAGTTTEGMMSGGMKLGGKRQGDMNPEDTGTGQRTDRQNGGRLTGY